MPALNDCELETLYREVVLDHYRRPRNREPLASPDAAVLIHNPLCGDQVRVEVSLESGRIQGISARTRGCSIAVASASVMTELVHREPSRSASKLRELMEQVVEEAVLVPDLDPRLRAFARVAELPSRRRCALLPWEALDAALKEAGDRSS